MYFIGEMKGQLIFRIFVDILSYLYEFFVSRDFVICSFSFVVVHLQSILGQGMGKTIHIIVIIINQIIFTLSINISCDSYKILVICFSNNLLISDCFTFNFQSLYFTSFFISSRFFIYNIPLLCPSQAQIFSSALYSQTPSTYVPPSV